MKIPLVTYHNFGPFTHVTFSLNDKGLVLIQGDNQVSTSADSNGSGKSFMLEGVAWGDFGETIRGLGPDEVVNNKAKKNCLVHIQHEVDGQLIETLRYRNCKAKHGLKAPNGTDVPVGSGFMLFVDGIDKTMGTVNETQKLFQELIGMDFKTFVRSVYFDGHQIQPFPTLTDKEIKEIFERVLNLESLQTVAKAIKTRKDTAASKVSGARSALALTQSNISTFNLELLEAGNQRDFFETTRKNAAAAHRRDAMMVTSASEADIDNAEEVYGAKERLWREELKRFDGLDEMITAHNLTVNQVQSQITAGDYEISALTGQLPRQGQVPAEFHQRQAEITAAINHASKLYNDHRATNENAASKIGTACRGCGKEYTQADLGSIVAHAAAHMATHAEEHRVSSEALAALNVEIVAAVAAKTAEITALITAKQEGMAGLREQIVTLSAKSASYVKLQALRKAADEQLATLPTHRAEIERLRSTALLAAAKRQSYEDAALALESQPNPHLEVITRFTKRLADANVEYTAESMELADEERKLALLEFLAEAYSNSGLKAHILQVITPALNEKANEYAQALADGSIKVEFTTTKANKDGSVSEKFGVTVTNSEGAECYLGNSSGERKKIDLAISLALSDLVMARSAKNFDLWVADEIAESLDPTALDRVVNVLGEMAKRRGTVLVISHTDLTGYIPNIVTVQKTNAGSVLR